MKLLKLDHAEMKKLGDDMWRGALNIRSIAMKMAWYSRGSMQYVDALNLSTDEFDLFNKLIDSNLEITKKSKLPFF